MPVPATVIMAMAVTAASAMILFIVVIRLLPDGGSSFVPTAAATTEITAWGPLLPWACLDDADLAAFELRAIEPVHGGERLGLCGHFYKGKAAGAASFAIGDDLDLRDLACSSAFKKFADLRFVRRVR